MTEALTDLTVLSISDQIRVVGDVVGTPFLKGFISNDVWSRMIAQGSSLSYDSHTHQELWLGDSVVQRCHQLINAINTYGGESESVQVEVFNKDLEPHQQAPSVSVGLEVAANLAMAELAYAVNMRVQRTIREQDGFLKHSTPAERIYTLMRNDTDEEGNKVRRKSALSAVLHHQSECHEVNEAIGYLKEELRGAYDHLKPKSYRELGDLTIIDPDSEE